MEYVLHVELLKKLLFPYKSGNNKFLNEKKTKTKQTEVLLFLGIFGKNNSNTQK